VAFYVDTSALVKLVVTERETESLLAWVRATTTPLVSSDLSRAELMRAVRRAAPDAVVQARAVLDALTLLSLSTETVESAGQLDPALLRTLDALHLASALKLGDDLEAIITYDERLATAAAAYGVTVLAP
jgi:uncharacterized protein